MAYDSSLTTWRDIARKPVLVTATTLGSVLTVEEIKQHLRIDIDDEDSLLQQYIDAAAAMVEEDSELALLTSTYAVYLDCFPAWEIELRKLPVASITSVVYLDDDGTSTTLGASLYRLDSKSRPSRLTPAYNQTWPTTYPVSNAVTVTFVAGNTSRDDVPDMAKQAIRVLVGNWYKHRESVVSTGAQPVEVPLAYDACISRLRWSGGV